MSANIQSKVVYGEWKNRFWKNQCRKLVMAHQYVLVCSFDYGICLSNHRILEQRIFFHYLKMSVLEFSFLIRIGIYSCLQNTAKPTNTASEKYTSFIYAAFTLSLFSKMTKSSLSFFVSWVFFTKSSQFAHFFIWTFTTAEQKSQKEHKKHTRSSKKSKSYLNTKKIASTEYNSSWCSEMRFCHATSWHYKKHLFNVLVLTYHFTQT